MKNDKNHTTRTSKTFKAGASGTEIPSATTVKCEEPDYSGETQSSLSSDED
jgi:hypothetical protein